MPNKKQQLNQLKGEQVAVYSIEKEFTGVLQKKGNEFSIVNKSTGSSYILNIKPSDIVDMKRISTMPVIFVRNHFEF